MKWSMNYLTWFHTRYSFLELRSNWCLGAVCELQLGNKNSKIQFKKRIMSGERERERERVKSCYAIHSFFFLGGWGGGRGRKLDALSKIKNEIYHTGSIISLTWLHNVIPLIKLSEYQQMLIFSLFLFFLQSQSWDFRGSYIFEKLTWLGIYSFLL